MALFIVSKVDATTGTPCAVDCLYESDSSSVIGGSDTKGGMGTFASARAISAVARSISAARRRRASCGSVVPKPASSRASSAARRASRSSSSFFRRAGLACVITPHGVSSRPHAARRSRQGLAVELATVSAWS